MARLSDLDIIRCTECGKLIQSRQGRTLCAECAANAPEAPTQRSASEKRFIDAVARHSGLSRGTAEPAAPKEPAAKTSKDIEECVRCKERPAVEESDLCIYCMLDLYRSLGNASNELFGRMELLEEESPSAPTVVSLLRDKEKLTGSSHFDFASGPHLRW